jgi:hypothetical protein
MRHWKVRMAFCRVLGALAVMSALLFTSQLLRAQNAPDDSQASQTSQQPATPPADQTTNDPTEQKTFTGVIAKSGDKLVLTDPLTKTSYQLDDQRKAQEMVNKNVKVTGVLDPSTGTIRVSAIEPL